MVRRHLALLFFVIGSQLAPGSDDRPGRFDDGSSVVAVASGRQICLNDVDRLLGSDGQALLRAVYELRVQAARAIADRYLLEDEAHRRNTTVGALVNEVAGKALPPADEAVALEMLNYSKIVLANGEIGARYRLASGLEADARAAALEQFLAALRKKTPVELVLTPPTLSLAARPGRAILGPGDAPLVVTLFLDYESKQSTDLLRGIWDAVSRESILPPVSLEVKHFPAQMKGKAFESAVVSACMAQMGRFDAFQKALAPGTDYGLPALIRASEAAGVSSKELQSCMTSGQADQEVRKDVLEGRSSGVAGAPAVFVGKFPVVNPSVENVSLRVRDSVATSLPRSTTRR